MMVGNEIGHLIVVVVIIIIAGNKKEEQQKEEENYSLKLPSTLLSILVLTSRSPFPLSKQASKQPKNILKTETRKKQKRTSFRNCLSLFSSTQKQKNRKEKQILLAHNKRKTKVFAAAFFSKGHASIATADVFAFSSPSPPPTLSSSVIDSNRVHFRS